MIATRRDRAHHGDMNEKSMNEIRAEECEYLRTEMPSSLRRLTEILLAGTFPPDSAWCGDLFLKLMQSVARVGSDLLAATESPEALPAVAWNARNMVELAIWSQYCGRSEKNARRFHEDALRDLKGLVNSHGQMQKFMGTRYEHEQLAHEMLDHVAQTTLGLDSIDAEYMSVSSAAKEVGLSGWYSPINKFLSKFAHPTAVLVIGIMHQTEILKDMQSACLAHGTGAARLCLYDLQRMVHALVSSVGSGC
jgi:hypothetical protein